MVEESVPWTLWAPAFAGGWSAGDTGGGGYVRGVGGGYGWGGGRYGWSAGGYGWGAGDSGGVRGIRVECGGIRVECGGYGWSAGDTDGVGGDSGGAGEGGLEVGGLAGWVLGFLLDDLPGLGDGIVEAAVFVGDDVFELVLARHLSLSLL